MKTRAELQQQQDQSFFARFRRHRKPGESLTTGTRLRGRLVDEVKYVEGKGFVKTGKQVWMNY